jgi:hypothetical protein
LTRPVVPPDGSFVSGVSFWRVLLHAISRHATRKKSEPRKAAMQAHGLTADSQDKPLFFRLSADQRRAVASLAGQFKSFPQNMYVTAN